MSSDNASIENQKNETHNIAGDLVVEGKFKKVKMKSLQTKKYGMYRGKGKITINDSGIIIEGRHVKSLGIRWGIGILLAIGSAILTMGAVILGIIPVYLLVEYVILSREDLSIPWDKLIWYGIDSKRKLVGFEFDGSDWTSPAIIRTDQIKELTGKLRACAPEKDVNVDVTFE